MAGAQAHDLAVQWVSQAQHQPVPVQFHRHQLCSLQRSEGGVAGHAGQLGRAAGFGEREVQHRVAKVVVEMGESAAHDVDQARGVEWQLSDRGRLPWCGGRVVDDGALLLRSGHEHVDEQCVAGADLPQPLVGLRIEGSPGNRICHALGVVAAERTDVHPQQFAALPQVEQFVRGEATGPQRRNYLCLAGSHHLVEEHG